MTPRRPIGVHPEGGGLAESPLCLLKVPGSHTVYHPLPHGDECLYSRLD